MNDTEKIETLKNAIAEEVEYLKGFRPDHGEYIMLLTGKMLERLEETLKEVS